MRRQPKPDIRLAASRMINTLLPYIVISATTNRAFSYLNHVELKTNIPTLRTSYENLPYILEAPKV